MVSQHVTSLAQWETVHLVIGTIVLAVILQAVFWLVSVIRKRLRDDEALKDFPGPPLHWFWGSNEDMEPYKRCEIVTQYDRVYGPVWYGRIGPTWYKVAIGGDPDYMKLIMNTLEPKERLISRIYGPWLGDGLLLTDGKRWVRNRRLLTPGFHFEILKPYIEVFSSSAHILLDKWKDIMMKEGRVEMFEHLSLLTLDNMLKCALSYHSNCQTNREEKNPYISAVYQLSELIMKRIGNPLHASDFMYYFSQDGYNFRQCCRLVHEYSTNVINNRKEEKKSGITTKRKFVDFLDILLDARDEDGKGLTDKEIRDEVDTFMFAGHDTTASALSWFFYNMAKHPEHQRKCQEEIDRVLGDRKEFQWEDLADLEYLTLCIKESMRIHSPVPVTSRHTTKPITLPNGLIIPAGMCVWIEIFALHRSPRVWEDPETYRPERFTPENSKDRSPNAFVPFFAGPRTCIGRQFAMNELKTCAAVALKQLDFSLLEGAEEPQPGMLTVLRAKDGIWLNVMERQ